MTERRSRSERPRRRAGAEPRGPTVQAFSISEAGGGFVSDAEPFISQKRAFRRRLRPGQTSARVAKYITEVRDALVGMRSKLPDWQRDMFPNGASFAVVVAELANEERSGAAEQHLCKTIAELLLAAHAVSRRFDRAFGSYRKEEGPEARCLTEVSVSLRELGVILNTDGMEGNVTAFMKHLSACKSKVEAAPILGTLLHAGYPDEAIRNGMTMRDTGVFVLSLALDVAYALQQVVLLHSTSKSTS